MERIGIFGGTFNPPHLGHMQAAQQAISALGLSKLLLIPNHTAPHKTLPSHSPTPAQRLEMLQLACRDIPGAEACPVELERDGPSYTWQTLEILKQQYPREELVLLMGSDMFESFLQWREPESILKNAALGVFCRGLPAEKEAIAAQKEKLEALGAKVYLVNNPVLEISSTQVRRLLVFQGAGAFLPEMVQAYIREHGLYGTGESYRNLSCAELEQVVVRLLKSNRVAHVLGCRDTAAELAERWGADTVDAQRAALLHDITKALDGPLQLALCRAYGCEPDAFSVQYPKTLHALTGSLVAQRIFGENQAVVDAIASHTTGKADMNLLEKIIYVADYMEPNRDFPGVEQLRYLTTVDMTQALAKGLQMTVALLHKQGSAVSPASREALEFLGIKM